MNPRPKQKYRPGSDMRRLCFSVNRTWTNWLCLFPSEDESHLLLRSHLTMEDLESEEFKVHDPCVAWLNGKDPCCDSHITPDRQSAHDSLKPL